jgi:nucleotide-binding universal stress UspA family protein
VDDEAGPVARTAARLARSLERDLVVLYVAIELGTAPAVASRTGLDEGVVKDRIRGEVEDRVRAFAEEQIDDLDVRVRVGEGDVVECIVAYAHAEAAELLVIGHHEHGILGRLFEGDPARALLDCTPCPVVVVPLQ